MTLETSVLDLAYGVDLLFTAVGYGWVFVIGLHLTAWGLGTVRTAFDFRDH